MGTFKMLGQWSFFRFVCSVLIASVLAVSGAADSASAASHSSSACTKRGYTTTFRDQKNAILKRQLRRADWEEGPDKYYACSLKYGRLVPLGLDGISPDGPEWVDVYALNSRYVAAGGGWAGNARAADNNYGIRVIDLSSGSAVSASSISSSASSESWVSKATVNRAGDVAWINGDSADGTTSYSVNLLPASGDMKRKVLFTSPSIDPNFLSWVAGTSRPIWSDPVESLPFTPRIAQKYSPVKGAKCTRRGERIEARGYGHIVTSKPFDKGGWDHGRVMIACSLKYKRRVVLAHSGTKDGATFSYSRPTSNEGFASVVVKRDAGGMQFAAAVLEVDLGSGALICAADPSGGLTGVSVQHVALDPAGTLAWVAEGEFPHDGGRYKDLQVCDGGSRRTLLRHPLLLAESVHFAPDRPNEILYTIDPRIAD